MNKKAGIITFLLFLILVIIIILNYSKIDGFIGNVIYENEIGNVTRVIDGDTVELENGDDVRLLGINTPEKKEEYYNEAKEYLKDRVEGKQVILRKGFEDKDRYNRKLRFIYLNDKNVNIELVENGFANPYFPDESMIYRKDFRDAWEICVENNINLCRLSNDVCSSCVKLSYLDKNNEEVEFVNNCNIECNLNQWTIKDEGRKKFIFKDYRLKPFSKVIVKVGEGQDSEKILYWRGEDYVWTETGDALYLRDDENKLVLYHEY